MTSGDMHAYLIALARQIRLQFTTPLPVTASATIQTGLEEVTAYPMRGHLSVQLMGIASQPGQPPPPPPPQHHHQQIPIKP